MQNADRYAELAFKLKKQEQEIDEKYGVYRSPLESLYQIDSMQVIVDYTAQVGRVAYFTRGEDHVFVQTKTVKSTSGEEWEDVPENPYVIRDEFFKVKTVGEALVFLQKTGQFSPLRPRFTWKAFQRWQQFARLVQEHNELANAMQSNSPNGDCREVLKALTGRYDSSFFDGCEENLYLHIEPKADPDTDPEAMRRLEKLASAIHEARTHEEFMKEFQQQALELKAQDAMAKGIQKEKENWRNLWQWFINPPSKIEWQPNSLGAYQKVLKLHLDPETGISLPIPEDSPLLRGGSMMEFLLTQDQLRPVLRLDPKTALQAIAAAIYAERIQGVAYRKCDWCGELFKISTHKTKRYCDVPKPCKGNARKKRQRERQRTGKALGASRRPKSKTNQAPRT